MEQELLKLKTFSEIMICASDVYGALTSLNLHKTKTADGIGPNILSRCALILYEPLTHPFSLTFSQETLPKDWNSSHHFFHKKGDRSLINNYRPISLLSAASKIPEHVIYPNHSPQVSLGSAPNIPQFGNY